jgi:hypothetical protein
MPSLAEDYLSRAKEYRRLAEREGDSAISAYLLELAETYEEDALDLKASPAVPHAQPGSRT